MTIHIFTNVLHEDRAESLALVFRTNGHNRYSCGILAHELAAKIIKAGASCNVRHTLSRCPIALCRSFFKAADTFNHADTSSAPGSQHSDFCSLPTFAASTVVLFLFELACSSRHRSTTHPAKPTSVPSPWRIFRKYGRGRTVYKVPGQYWQHFLAGSKDEVFSCSRYRDREINPGAVVLMQLAPGFDQNSPSLPEICTTSVSFLDRLW
jgi:hypothetical protein